MAVGTSRIARDIAFTLEMKSPKIFENIFLNNGILFMLGSKGRVKIKAGGNRFDERTHLGQNSNVDTRGKFSQIPTAFQNNFQTAQYGHSVISGAVPINMVEVDQNAGAQKISDLTAALVKELKDTFPNKVAAKLMAASEDSNSPLSLKVQLPATAFGSQTQTTGGLVRSDYPGTGDETKAWQTRYNSDAASLDGAAGIATVSKFLWGCAAGSARDLQPDIGVTTIGVLAKASAAADVLRRYTSDDKSLKFRFDNIMIGNATLIADINAATKAGYFINTNFAQVQVLKSRKMGRTGSVKVIGDGAVSVPLSISAPIEAEDYLNVTIKAWLVYNLTFGALKYHGLMDNLTEA